MNVQLQLPPLRAGDRMDADEFLRRWDATPGVKRAELLYGVAFMPSPVLADHGRPNNWLQFWLSVYAMFTAGVEVFTNTSFRLDDDNVPQPDAALALLVALGGRVWLDERTLPHGAPDLVVEVCSSQPRPEGLERLETFCRFGARECVALFVPDGRVEWYDRGPDGSPVRRADPEDGIFRSTAFPGLWLDATAAVSGDRARLFAAVQAGTRTPEHAAFAAELARLAATP